MSGGLDNPGLVMRRIEDHLADLADRQGPFEAAVAELERLEARWEFRYLTTLETASGSSAEKRKATAYTATVAAHPDFYKDLVEKRAEVKATRAVVGLLDTQLSALQSVLRAQTREAYGSNSAAQPQWSRREQ